MELLTNEICLIKLTYSNFVINIKCQSSMRKIWQKIKEFMLNDMFDIKLMVVNSNKNCNKILYFFGLTAYVQFSFKP